MAINHPSRNDLDARLAAVLRGPANALDNLSAFRDFLYTLGGDDTAVKAALVSEFNYTSDEATVVLNAVNALYQLKLVATAQAAQAIPDDFFFNARKIWGINTR